jgi:hypothetical protein
MGLKPQIKNAADAYATPDRDSCFDVTLLIPLGIDYEIFDSYDSSFRIPLWRFKKKD